MAEEPFKLDQKRTIQNAFSSSSTTFEIIELESEEVFMEWLEVEKNLLEWQKQSEKTNVITQDEVFYH